MRVSLREITTATVFFFLGIVFHINWKSMMSTKSNESTVKTISASSTPAKEPSCRCPTLQPIQPSCGKYNRYNLIDVYKSSSYDRGKNIAINHDVTYFASKVSVLLHVASQQNYHTIVEFMKKNFTGTDL